MNRRGLKTVLSCLILTVFYFNSISPSYGFGLRGKGTAIITVTAASNSNPGPSGPAPITIEIFVLHSTARFEATDYFSLKSSAPNVLGDDLIDARALSIRPGETKDIQIPLQHRNSYIAVAAGFREIQKAQWKVVVPARSTHMLTISRLGLKIS